MHKTVVIKDKYVFSWTMLPVLLIASLLTLPEGGSLFFLFQVCLNAVLIMIAYSDYTCEKIPNQYLVILLSLGIIKSAFYHALGGALIGSILLFLLLLFTPIPGGDVKYFCVSIWILGWYGFVVALVLLSVFVTIYGIATRTLKKHTEVRIGPHFGLAIWLTLRLLHYL